MSIKSFNDKLSSKTLRNILIIIIFAVLIYGFYKKKANEIKQMKEVLMYSREENMKKLREERQNAKDEEIKIKEEAEKKTEEIVQEYGKIMSQKEIEDYRIQQLRNIQSRRRAIKKENTIKKSKELLKDFDIDLGETVLEYNNIIEKGKEILKSTPKNIPNIENFYSDILEQYDKKTKNKKFDLKREIKRGDIVVVNSSYSQKTVNKIKELNKNVNVDSVIKNNKSYKELMAKSKQYLDINNLDDLVENENLIIMKIGYKSPVYDKLVGKKINAKLAIKSNDLLSNFENSQWIQAKIDYNKQIELYKKLHPESEMVFPDFFEELNLDMNLEVLDFVDDITIRKYDLTENLDNIDSQETRAQERALFKEYIKDELKNVKDTSTN